MLFTKKFRKRSAEEEIIDDFNLGGDDVVKTFQTIERVNSLLGGNRTFVNGVKLMIESLGRKDREEPIVIYDLGSGSGDGLRALAKWAKQQDIPIQLKGIDANAFIVNYANEQAKTFPNIQFEHHNIFEDTFALGEADFVTFNLCLHHFSDEENQLLLDKCKAHGVKATLINDLHRHWLAYYLFEIFCRLTFANHIARKDGLLSILKGFTKKELMKLFSPKRDESIHLKWKWAFRYQMILYFNQ